MAPFFCRLWMFKRSTSSLKKPERETQQDSVMRRSSFIRDLKHYQREETERAAMFPSSSFLVMMKMRNDVEISAVFTLTWQKTDSNAKNSSKVIHQPLSILVDVKHFVFQHVTNANNSSTCLRNVSACSQNRYDWYDWFLDDCHRKMTALFLPFVQLVSTGVRPVWFFRADTDY